MRVRGLLAVLSLAICLIALSASAQSNPPYPASNNPAGSSSVSGEASSEPSGESVPEAPASELALKAKNDSSEGAKSAAIALVKPVAIRPDFNQDVFYRNKLEFSLDGGWLPINIPFPFDFMMGDSYNTYPLKYTLVPIIGSLRWQLGGLGGPSFLRGNWDLEFSGAVVAIPRGPETRYFSYIMGMRRNFVPRNWRVTPYIDWRAGLGNIDAKGPLGVPYAQGQDFTFTLNLGSGVRYNLSPRYAFTAGLNWMHISNANMSQGTPPNWGIRNYGINVVGPMIGLDITLRGHPRHSE
ncbi:MAG TPA: acyloxyacyl hydrolase [Candidatus Sulfotelmatobacter sp.]|nr:acyloxyacyl hydrolase [Candidatus Sulfotelmatobacter sp.]